ncbi:hypothetical protein BaRGS_00029658, partial [Batillaria attramentaria]
PAGPSSAIYSIQVYFLLHGRPGPNKTQRDITEFPQGLKIAYFNSVCPWRPRLIQLPVRSPQCVHCTPRSRHRDTGRFSTRCQLEGGQRDCHWNAGGSVLDLS